MTGLDLQIADGELLVIIGPSGCGKTTTLRMMAGLEEISEGEVRIGERLVNSLDPRERDVAMVFQNYALYPHMTVFDNLAFPLRAPQADESGDRGRRSSGPRGCSGSTVYSSASRERSQADSANGWRWAGRSSASHRCS